MEYLTYYPGFFLLLLAILVLKFKFHKLEKRVHDQDSEISKLKRSNIDLKYKNSKDKEK